MNGDTYNLLMVIIFCFQCKLNHAQMIFTNILVPRKREKRTQILLHFLKAHFYLLDLSGQQN